MFPDTKSCDLSLCNLWARCRLAILFAFCEPRYKGLACRLTRFGWREEEFHQLLQSGEIWIVSDLLQLWLFHVHDVLSAFRGGGDENYFSDERWAVQRNLLRDHPAEGVTHQ